MPNLKFALTAGIAALTSLSASAWFFIIPGKAIEALSDAITGSEGENCVTATAKVGDTIAIGGSIMRVKSLSGTSIRCTNAEFPIRALLELIPRPAPQWTYSPPEGWEATTPTDAQKKQGVFFSARRSYSEGWLIVYSVPLPSGKTFDDLLTATRLRQMQILESPDASSPTAISLQGRTAWQFTVKGAPKGNSWREYVYTHTVFEANGEFIGISVWMPPDLYESKKAEIQLAAEGFNGLPAASKPIDVATPPTAPPSPVAASATPATPSSPTAPQLAPTASPVPQPAPTPSTAPQAPPLRTEGKPNTSAIARLKELNAIYKEGLIDQKEFEARKQRILDSI